MINAMPKTGIKKGCFSFLNDEFKSIGPKKSKGNDMAKYRMPFKSTFLFVIIKI